MPHLTCIPWIKFEKFLLFIGCEFKRENGDHRIYSREGIKRPIVVPRDKAVPKFIIKNNLNVLGVSVAEYLEILERI